MRIVFLSYNYSADIDSPRAWFKRLSYYVGWLEILAKDHKVIRVDHINFEGVATHNGVEYHFLNSGGPGYFPLRLHKMVKTFRPDVVVVSSFMFPVQLMQLRQQLGKKVRIIVQNHAERPFAGFKKLLQKFASKQVNHFLFTSTETGHEWIKTGNIVSSASIVELMEVSSIFQPPDKKFPNASPVFLWVGRLNKNKDPLIIVRAFLQFAKVQPDAKLYMIYQTDELLAEIKKMLPDASPVIMLGKISHEELLHWYTQTDFFLSGSHHEGSGTALCEAMSCGCIPIVTNIPSFRAITRGCGFLYEAGNQQALLTAMRNAINADRHTAAQNVLTQFKERLSFQAIAQRFQRSLFEQINSESTSSQTSSIGRVNTGE
jgi:glycosyltransferase involved in cell wall biosynthesis